MLSWCDQLVGSVFVLVMNREDRFDGLRFVWHVSQKTMKWSQNMKTITHISFVVMAFFYILGCAADYGSLKNQSKSESQATLEELGDNWSDYHIWFKSAAIVFDPKNDDKEILVGSDWEKVEDQETWARIVKENTTAEGILDPLWANYPLTNVREIWSPDNELYGYVIHQRPDSVGVTMVDENTMRLFYNRARFGGP
jgi:hypothetical protein